MVLNDRPYLILLAEPLAAETPVSNGLCLAPVGAKETVVVIPGLNPAEAAKGDSDKLPFRAIAVPFPAVMNSANTMFSTTMTSVTFCNGTVTTSVPITITTGCSTSTTSTKPLESAHLPTQKETAIAAVVSAQLYPSPNAASPSPRLPAQSRRSWDSATDPARARRAACRLLASRRPWRRFASRWCRLLPVALGRGLVRRWGLLRGLVAFYTRRSQWGLKEVEGGV